MVSAGSVAETPGGSWWVGIGIQWVWGTWEASHWRAWFSCRPRLISEPLCWVYKRLSENAAWINRCILCRRNTRASASQVLLHLTVTATLWKRSVITPILQIGPSLKSYGTREEYRRQLHGWKWLRNETKQAKEKMLSTNSRQINTHENHNEVPLELLKPKGLTVSSAAEDAGEHGTPVHWWESKMQNREKSLAGFYKVRHTLPVGPSNSTPTFLPERNYILFTQNLHVNVHSNSTHNSQKS